MNSPEEHLFQEQLTRLAFGEESPTDVVALHLARCLDCRSELTALETIVALGRQTQDLNALPPPPQRVWKAIQAATAESVSADTPGTRSVALHRPNLTTFRLTSPRSARSRVAILAAFLMIVATLSAVVTLGVARPRTEATAQVLAHADLSPLPAAPDSAHGTAELVRNGTAVQLRLALTGMPAPAGYYEAWLFDPATRQMYPMGPIVSTGGTVTVNGVNLDRFTGVDISAQPTDTAGTHGTSMLQGIFQS